MRIFTYIYKGISKRAPGHRLLLLLLFVFTALCAFSSLAAPPQKRPKAEQKRPKAEKITLKHADRWLYDQYRNPEVQIFSGHVVFDHNGLLLYCDSANFYQMSNSFRAFGHVRMVQGDTLSLKSETLYYDGNSQIAQARNKVELDHRKSKLFTDSLNYDRVYDMGYFFEGGRLIDNGSELTSDWGQYNTATREALFNYNVVLKGKDYNVKSDTLYYDTRTKLSHMLGPSNIVNKDSHIYTENGFFNTETKNVILLQRSIVVNNEQQIVGDSVLYNKDEGVAQAFGNVFLNDKKNKNILTGNYCYYNDSTGFALAYDSAEIKNYSQKDTLYLHADTFKIFTYNLKTDSVYRIVHGYNHMRSYRADIQSVADSLSYNSLERRLSLYGNPIVWSDARQILGEEIHAFFNDSTIDSIQVINQALTVEKIDTAHFNQVTGREMRFFFLDGQLHEYNVAGNVEIDNYAFDDDSVMIGMNHTETSLFRLFMADKKVSKMITREGAGTFYPLPFVTHDNSFLSNFAWFDYMRPKDKNDIFQWKKKTAGTELKKTVRRDVPFQSLKKKKQG